MLGFAILLGCAVGACFGQDVRPDEGDSPATGRYQAAWNLLLLLEEDEAAAAKRSFNDPERIGWSFFPAKRNGLRVGDLDDEERARFDEFLLVALGEHGVEKVGEVRQVEPVTDRGGGVVTGPDEYHVTFFGPVSQEEPWGWRLEGHHIALNQTMRGDTVISSTPSFLGSFPLRGKDGLEPLRREITLARELVAMMREDVRTRAVDAEVPREVVTGMQATWDPPQRKGVPLADLSPPERKILRKLANEHVSIHADDVVVAFFETWDKTDPEKIHFVWFGAADDDEPHGYRIQGPHWVMEYVNFQGGANHVHTVWRTHDGEFLPIASR